MPSNKQNTILFLFRELAGYFVTCVEALGASKSTNVEVVYWPVNAQAPLAMKTIAGVKWIAKEDWRLSEAIQKDRAGEYSCVIVSGWGDLDYNAFVKAKGQSKKVLAFDTQWSNALRVMLGSQWIRWTLSKFYDGAWVPGARQAKLAVAMGFNKSEIDLGFYVADVKGIGSEASRKGNQEFKIGFVSRFVKEKGFPDVINHMISLLDTHKNWQVHLFGTGPLQDQMPKHSQIFYHGFSQPETLKKVWGEWDVFVLASGYEPWGVVVHEAAGAGLPIIATQAVGAADVFVESGLNGWIVPIGDYQSINQSILKLSQMTTEEREKMRLISFEKSKLLNIEQWCGTVKKWMI